MLVDSNVSRKQAPVAYSNEYLPPDSPLTTCVTQRARPTTACTVILADDQAIFRAGVARVLGAEEDLCVHAQCDTTDEVIELLPLSEHCVLVIAQSLYVAGAERLLAAVTASAARTVLIAEAAGIPQVGTLRKVDGMLTRQTSAAELVACVRRVHKGERSLHMSSGSADAVGARMRDMLSQREMQIIGFVVQGCKNRQIAESIGTTEQVVKNYLRSIYDKTGASDRLELALFALHHRALASAANAAAQLTA